MHEKKSKKYNQELPPISVESQQVEGMEEIEQLPPIVQPLILTPFSSVQQPLVQYDDTDSDYYDAFAEKRPMSDRNNGKHPKKKLSKGKKIFIIIVAVLLVIVIAGLILLYVMRNSGSDEPLVAETNRHNYVGLMVMPDYAGSFSSDIPSDEKAKKQYAYDLYKLGMLNAKNVDNMLAYGPCATMFNAIDIKNYIDLDIVMIKSPEEYFRIDYRLKNNVPFLDKMKMFEKQINNSLELVITERFYTNNDMDYMLYQKVHNAEYGADKLPIANWTNESDPIIEQEQEKYVFNKNIEGDMCFCGYTINTDTMKTVNIEHDKKNKFYIVEMVFDTENPETTKDIVGLIRAGSGDPNANYSSITMKFTIWENGYLRTMESHEFWQAAALGVKALKFESSFDYNWMFSYDARDYDMAKCADMQLMKSQIAGRIID